MAQQRINALTLEEVQFIAFSLARESLSFNEPIPDFSTRFPDRLESCVAQPFLKCYGKSLYPTLISKASILLYLMIKNHPFVNGNKRIAITTLFVFLYENGKWLKVDTKELYEFTVWIARSPARIKDPVVAGIEEFIGLFLVDLKNE